MKKVLAVLLLSLPIVASASNCDEISASIAEKITNNGVQASQFQLKLAPATQTEQLEGKIVGSCDRGQQNILYVRLDGVSTTAAPVAKPALVKAPEPVATPAPAPEAKSEPAAPIAEPKAEAPAESAEPTPAAEPAEAAPSNEEPAAK